jgi:hypothetical protein
VIAPLPKAWHLEVRITGYSDMTLEMEAHGVAGVAHKATLTAKSQKC